MGGLGIFYGHTMMDEVEYDKNVWVIYFINTALLLRFLHMPIAITGGRTSLFLTSQRMPSRYVLRLQVYRTVEFIGVENICVWYFWGDILYKHSVVGDNTYFIYTKMGGGI